MLASSTRISEEVLRVAAANYTNSFAYPFRNSFRTSTCNYNAAPSPCNPPTFLPEHVLNSKILTSKSLIVSRGIEWLTVLAGVEQANVYSIKDGSDRRVGLIVEDIRGVGGAIAQQLLRTHRTFTANIFDANGTEPLLKIHRPAYLLAGEAVVTLPDGTLVGAVRKQWHLYRPVYHLYAGTRQYARITEGFLAWDFRLQTQEGGTLGLVERKFQGAVRELATDAGRYVLHFGASFASEGQGQVAERDEEQEARPKVSWSAKRRAGAKVAASDDGGGEILEVERALSPEERLVALACAVCIDFDYFSHLSWESGYLNTQLDGYDGLEGLAQRQGDHRTAGTTDGGSMPGGGVMHQAAEGGHGASGGTGSSSSSSNSTPMTYGSVLRSGGSGSGGGKSSSSSSSSSSSGVGSFGGSSASGVGLTGHTAGMGVGIGMGAAVVATSSHPHTPSPPAPASGLQAAVTPGDAPSGVSTPGDISWGSDVAMSMSAPPSFPDAHEMLNGPPHQVEGFVGGDHDLSVPGGMMMGEAMRDMMEGDHAEWAPVDLTDSTD